MTNAQLVHTLRQAWRVGGHDDAGADSGGCQPIEIPVSPEVSPPGRAGMETLTVAMKPYPALAQKRLQRRASFDWVSAEPRHRRK